MRSFGVQTELSSACLQVLCISVIIIALTVAILSVQVQDQQPAGECSDYVTNWIWVFFATILMGCIVNFVAVVQASGERAGTIRARIARVCQVLYALFAFAWWVTGLVWYVEANDAGCSGNSMALMLSCVVLPGILLGMVCLAAVFAGLSEMWTERERREATRPRTASEQKLYLAGCAARAAAKEEAAAAAAAAAAASVPDDDGESSSSDEEAPALSSDQVQAEVQSISSSANQDGAVAGGDGSFGTAVMLENQV